LDYVLEQWFIPDPLCFGGAGRVDGAADLRILWSILIPLAMPAIVAAGLLGIILSWNAFIFPFMLATSTDLYTLPVSLLYFQNVQLWSTAHERIGVAVVATLPPIVVFIVAQRRVMSGFTGGLKT
jgi:ABC-type glycerol-3-phosphate transport system permease component